MKNRLVSLREGRAVILAPNPEDYLRPDGVYEPAWAPVFYNPRMSFNRDIAVLFLRVYAKLANRREPIVVEPLAGTGVRAVRYALEAGARVYASDINPKAVDLVKANTKANSVEDRVVVERAEANRFMYSLYEAGVKPDLVDIDPFGSPAPFIDAALALLRGRGVLAATATDVAVLAASYPSKLRRRYGAEGVKTPWFKEQAVRTLLSYIARRAASYDYAVKPLLAYYADYYVRVYVLLERGAGKALEALKEQGYGYVCTNCYYSLYKAIHYNRKLCPYCGASMKPIGPIHIGKLCDETYIDAMLEELEGLTWIDRERASKLLVLARNECRLSKPYIRLDKICSYLHTNMPRLDPVIEALRRKGYEAFETHFDNRAFKTNAPYPLVLKLVQELSPTYLGERE